LTALRKRPPLQGRTGTLHPNPWAVGIPASPWPILVDMSMGITANSSYRRVMQEGGRMPGRWIQVGIEPSVSILKSVYID
jgi:LDH2 family malate/lactate/ureidoglycolate dehydrogenase